MTDHLRETIQRHKVGEPVGIYSICSAHPVVLEAASAERSHLVDVIEERMLAQPGYGQNYYEGDAGDQRIARRYSYSDRLRYYWPDPEIEAAEAALYANLSGRTLPDQYVRVRAGELEATPRALVQDKIRDALRPYAAATIPVLRTLSSTASNQGELLV